eukprot:984798-Pelagomonas_calceolata.AAC.4
MVEVRVPQLTNGLGPGATVDKRLRDTGLNALRQASTMSRLHHAPSAGMLSGQAVNAARGTKEKQLPSSGLSFVPPLLKEFSIVYGGCKRHVSGNKIGPRVELWALLG